MLSYHFSTVTLRLFVFFLWHTHCSRASSRWPEENDRNSLTLLLSCRYASSLEILVSTPSRIDTQWPERVIRLVGKGTDYGSAVGVQIPPGAPVFRKLTRRPMRVRLSCDDTVTTRLPGFRRR